MILDHIDGLELGDDLLPSRGNELRTLGYLWEGLTFLEAQVAMNELLVAGEPNAAVRELWEGTARRSFLQVDGQRRVRDLVNRMVPTQVSGQDRWMIYPGRDERVVRVLKKIIRGLAHFHGLESAVSENRVWADVMKYRIPEELAADIVFQHREPDVCEYWFEAYDDGEQSSFWLLRFFERRLFIGAVDRLTRAG